MFRLWYLLCSNNISEREEEGKGWRKGILVVDDQSPDFVISNHKKIGMDV